VFVAKLPLELPEDVERKMDHFRSNLKKVGGWARWEKTG